MTTVENFDAYTDGLYLTSPTEELVQVHHVTSDTHVGHRNIAKYTGRPYPYAEDTSAMDADLTRLWNESVQPDENVLHLGDAALGQITESVRWYGKMNGRKFLVPGNHDYISSVSSKSRQERYAEVYAEFFIVLAELIELTAVYGGRSVRMRACHYPTASTVWENDKYDSLRPPAGDRVPLVHGHTHHKDIFNPEAPFEFHAGADAQGLKPVRAEVIARWAVSVASGSK